MNSRDEVSFRLGLAEGFPREATQDFSLERWRSCVDNAQLCVENSGKAIIALFEVPGKTHAPALDLARLVREEALPDRVKSQIKEALPDFLVLGADEHFMTDDGDEDTYTLPWELFTRESAETAMDTAKKCLQHAVEIVADVREHRD
jgi:HEPN domain-containing protein